MDPRASLTFVGTATTVLRLGAFTLLTDPNFVRRGERVHLGYGLTSKRRTDPAMRIDELPRLDAVLLSHLHGDHFDRVARRDLPREPPVVTTRHAARRLQHWGFGGATGLATWEDWEAERGDERLRITSVPGRHGPTGVHRLLPPVMGGVLDLERGGQRVLRAYVTGDTLDVPELRAIRERFPGIDVMITHLGGTRVLGVLVTMDGRQGADLVEMIGPAVVVPVHHDDYAVFRSPLEDFVAELRRRGQDERLRPVARGDTVTLAPQPR
ncbi:MBL fold metallo-hydrolase [Pseudonocardia kunmingensis]|uniref:L-ascorbate metabolism protein UlaG (Beta-lactamase superfamily) n=1 Tax=Pseudonocardia kunmingensis TaxID=630975 RepID=A0A543D1E6_9PSEU|nr:MBL fold metallo-hydrolase [Pseudonocardia kunmingensis]TQM03157.1 L-ascorbate metabolism protein UlaG (beta-lactamase superfamily) [Pseudonocardia kunmingensis]